MEVWRGWIDTALIAERLTTFLAPATMGVEDALIAVLNIFDQKDNEKNLN